MISPNTIVGSRYRVVKALGGGGMKLVYLAEDLRLAARPCALAEMVDSITNPQMQSQAVASFQREADMLAELNNEHIPRIYDRFNEQNRHYLVMEFIDGVTLEQALKGAGGKLAQERLLEIALQILDTLKMLRAAAKFTCCIAAQCAQRIEFFNPGAARFAGASGHWPRQSS